MIYVSLGSVKISRLIYCQRHPAISSTLLLLKAFSKILKCLQRCKQENTAKLSKPGAWFLLTLSKGPELLGILSQMIHTNCQVVKSLPTFRPSTGHVRN